MNRTFIETPIFTKKWHELNLTDDDLIRLQNDILNGLKGDTIQGTNGLKKIRIACNGHGKRGGARVLYVDIEIKEKVHLINVYQKNEKEDLSEGEKHVLAVLVQLLKEE